MFKKLLGLLGKVSEFGKIQKASAVSVAKLLESGVKEFLYTYDMGDNWEHRIIVERVEPAKDDVRYPWFLGGERRCPPEDCGGIPGYHEFSAAIAAPDKGRGSKQKKEALAWYGRPYDPENIEQQKIEIMLRHIAGQHLKSKKSSTKK